MRKKSQIALYELMFNYCMYQLSLKVDFKDPRRCDRYNLLLNMIMDIEDIRNDGDMYQDILFDYYEYGEDWGQSVANKIMFGISNLDIGIWEAREDENGKLYLYEEIYEEVVKKIDIREILSSEEYLDNLYRLKAEEERRSYEVGKKYEEVLYGHIEQESNS